MTSKTADVDSLKQSLRFEMRALRASLPAGERTSADAAIQSLVLGLPSYQNAQTVFTYLSFGSEVATRGVIEAAWRDGKTVVLPRCMEPRQMRWFSVENFDGLERSPFGVDEPRICVESEVSPEAAEAPLRSFRGSRSTARATGSATAGAITTPSCPRSRASPWGFAGRSR